MVHRRLADKTCTKLSVDPVSGSTVIGWSTCAQATGHPWILSSAITASGQQALLSIHQASLACSTVCDVLLLGCLVRHLSLRQAVDDAVRNPLLQQKAAQRSGLRPVWHFMQLDKSWWMDFNCIAMFAVLVHYRVNRRCRKSNSDPVYTSFGSLRSQCGNSECASTYFQTEGAISTTDLDSMHDTSSVAGECVGTMISYEDDNYCLQWDDAVPPDVDMKLPMFAQPLTIVVPVGQQPHISNLLFEEISAARNVEAPNFDIEPLAPEDGLAFNQHNLKEDIFMSEESEETWLGMASNSLDAMTMTIDINDESDSDSDINDDSADGGITFVRRWTEPARNARTRSSSGFVRQRTEELNRLISHPLFPLPSKPSPKSGDDASFHIIHETEDSEVGTPGFVRHVTKELETVENANQNRTPAASHN
eukprot:CAMPEP_0172668642 /NCGR_PEP_ID=MMETSP1074-20121228/9184_1 /TAXON_ID=2916 /ORGANISM="Ceratium fusus, Strain PA161109" /LENGTH=420 /DNA_ID=CAMNT_0013485309 /DNA_START=67 /DNA_END=1329 /DNA_ORIENTATION=+